MDLKVCGLTRENNILEVLAAGVDYIGLIFYPLSKRCIPPDPLLEAFLKALKGVRKVGVFVDEDPAVLHDYVQRYQLDVVQLHGNESPDYCAAVAAAVKVWKAFGVNAAFDFGQLKDYAPYCSRLLFDTAGKGYGGTGTAFDWSLLDAQPIPLPFMLAGGIGPEDAGKVKAIQHPWFKGIDLNSRFEITPGLKDAGLIKNFIYEIRN